jgi:hypothetical protein
MSSIVISGDTSGAITLAAPAVAGTNTATLPAAAGTVMVSGNMPTFSYYQSVAQTLSTSTWTKITFTTSEWDTTGGMYASSRFTPTIAGYYQITGAFTNAASSAQVGLALYKNGSNYKRLFNTFGGGSVSTAVGTSLVYLNGSTDYVEIYANTSIGQNSYNFADSTYFQAVMVRAA